VLDGNIRNMVHLKGTVSYLNAQALERVHINSTEVAFSRSLEAGINREWGHNHINAASVPLAQCGSATGMPDRQAHWRLSS
jgi:uncharacterized lipoprotein YehR (DUF1307 family)